MLWCALGMGATMVVLAGLYIETSEKGNEAAQAVSVLCLFIFNCWFTIGWLGMSWYVFILSSILQTEQTGSIPPK
jgi:hypothetical protein